MKKNEKDKHKMEMHAKTPYVSTEVLEDIDVQAGDSREPSGWAWVHRAGGLGGRPPTQVAANGQWVGRAGSRG